MKINKTYRLKNALTLNATGEKVDAIAMPIEASEIRKHKAYFGFDFIQRIKEGYTVYKLCIPGQPGIIQGMVAFKQTPGVLNCGNMEVNDHNKRGKPLYGGIGKAIVALCCKISLDNDMDGYITFEAKTRLTNYYKRLGAYTVFGISMAIEPPNSQKLIDLFFKKMYL